MSLVRHLDPVVRGYAVTHPAGEVLLPAQPGWDQIIYAKSGVLVVRAEREAWTVPPHRALCVGNGTPVRLKTRKPVAVRCLYLRTEIGALAASTRVINVTTLTRELLLLAIARCPFSSEAVAGSALLALLFEQLAAHPTAALQLPIPADSRAADLAEIILAEPARTLEQAIDGVSASRRSLERSFAGQVGMTLPSELGRRRELS